MTDKTCIQIRRILSGFTPTAPIMRLLAYLKNDFGRLTFEDRLIIKMVKGWQEMKVLDLGCGPCNKERDRRFRKIDITCVDLHEGSLEVCKCFGFKILQADIRKINQYFPNKSVDIIWLLDTLEHLRKNDGLVILQLLKEIARKQVIVWVPAGFSLQDGDSDNPYQKHRSGWYENDFTKIGYHCEVLKNYHHDIRKYSEKLRKFRQPVPLDAMWAIWIKK